MMPRTVPNSPMYGAFAAMVPIMTKRLVKASQQLRTGKHLRLHTPVEQPSFDRDGDRPQTESQQQPYDADVDNMLHDFHRVFFPFRPIIDAVLVVAEKKKPKSALSQSWARGSRTSGLIMWELAAGGALLINDFASQYHYCECLSSIF